MMIKTKIALVFFLIIFGLMSVKSQNIILKNGEKFIEDKDSTTIIKAPNYILNVKFKQKPNGKKKVITSMEYVDKKTKIAKSIAAQKRRILKANKDTNKLKELSKAKKEKKVF